jgi:uncharacterized protein (TIGR02597 family)
MRPPVALDRVAFISGNDVRLAHASSWINNQFVYSGGAQSNTYYLFIQSGGMAGKHFTITANAADTVTVDPDGETLTSLAPGDSVAIVPYWTLGTVFPAGLGVNASGFPGARATEILFPNLSGVGINLSAAATYYYWNDAWRKVGSGGTIKNDDVILPDMYFIARQNVTSTTILTTCGIITTCPLQTFIRRNASSNQDNMFSLMRPVPVSLNDTGLIASGAFRTSPFPGQRVDELLVFNNAATAKNKSASGTYYHYNGAWRKLGSGAADVGADAVFVPGTGVILRAGPGGPAFWLNDPNY